MDLPPNIIIHPARRIEIQYRQMLSRAGDDGRWTFRDGHTGLARVDKLHAKPMLEKDARVPVRTAVETAIGYVTELYQGQPLRDLLLEEVEYSESTDKWIVTIGFSFPETQEVLSSVILPSKTSRQLSRRYKTVVIDAATGTPVSMKIRAV